MGTEAAIGDYAGTRTGLGERVVSVLERPASGVTHRTKKATCRSEKVPADNPFLEHIRAKQEIILQLLDGRLDLLEAASRFQGVDRLLKGQGVAEPSAEHGERVCRMVIGWVQLALADRPERAEVVTARFEQELQEHLAKQGAVVLP
jgi:hypothetical protein